MFVLNKIRHTPTVISRRTFLLGKLFNPAKIPITLYPYPEFKKLQNHHFEKATSLYSIDVYQNNIFWVPRYYIHNPLSQRFIEELEKFKHRKNWDETDSLALQ